MKGDFEAEDASPIAPEPPIIPGIPPSPLKVPTIIEFAISELLKPPIMPTPVFSAYIFEINTIKKILVTSLVIKTGN